MGATIVIQATIEEARALLAFMNKLEAENPELVTDEMHEENERMEWAIKNAEALQAMFFGQIDMCAINEVTHCFAHLVARVPGWQQDKKKLH
jgi:hypothetical protein